MSENDIRTLMGSAASDGPPATSAHPVIASAAAARTRRRRAWYGVGALGAAARTVTVVATVSLGLLGRRQPGSAGRDRHAAAVRPRPIDPGGISLPTSLPLGELVGVVDERAARPARPSASSASTPRSRPTARSRCP